MSEPVDNYDKDVWEATQLTVAQLLPLTCDQRTRVVGSVVCQFGLQGLLLFVDSRGARKEA